MTFAQLQTRLNKGIQRSDLVSELPSFINSAIRDICTMRSWRCMKTAGEFVITSGTRTVALPANFKELQKRKEPVCLVLADGALRPIKVVLEESELRTRSAFGGSMTPSWQVYLEQDETSSRLGIIDDAGENLTFRVKYYKYLPELTADGDTNFFTLNQEEMVLARAKELAFRLINDPAKAEAESDFLKEFRDAAVQESHAEIQGLELRM